MPQQQEQQQRGDHQAEHAHAEQPLPALRGGDLQRGEFLLGFEQRDLMLLQLRVEFHLEIGQATLAGFPLGDFLGVHRPPQVDQRPAVVAALLGKPRKQALGLGHREVGKRKAAPPRIPLCLDRIQGLSREVARLADLAHQRVQVAGGSEQPRGAFRRVGQVFQAFAQPAEGPRPVLDVGGDADRGGVGAHPQRGRHFRLLQQAGETLQRRRFLAGQPEVAQAHELEPGALLRREFIQARSQVVEPAIGFTPVRGDRQPLDLRDLRFQPVVGKHRRGCQHQHEDGGNAGQPAHGRGATADGGEDGGQYALTMWLVANWPSLSPVSFLMDA